MAAPSDDEKRSPAAPIALVTTLSAASAAQLMRRLSALSEASLRERAAVRFLRELPPALGAGLLEHALQRLRRGSPDEVAAGSALVQSVLPDTGLDGEQRSALYAAARSAGHLAAALFLSPPAHKEAPAPRPGALEGELSLGHRRTLARTVAPERFGRLGAEQDARVARELLQNPRLTEREVLRLASRRPAQPDVLVAISRSPRFATRLSVRTSLARNPYSPVGLALHLIPSLPEGLLRDISRDATLHPLVRQFAGALLAV